MIELPMSLSRFIKIRTKLNPLSILSRRLFRHYFQNILHLSFLFAEKVIFCAFAIRRFLTLARIAPGIAVLWRRVGRRRSLMYARRVGECHRLEVLFESG